MAATSQLYYLTFAEAECLWLVCGDDEDVNALLHGLPKG
jgi:hypothetical protein